MLGYRSNDESLRDYDEKQKRREEDRQKSAPNELERRINKLELICMALWSLLRENTDLTDDDLAARVEKIDAMDGSVDGRVAKGQIKCPQCNRVMSSKHEKCMYCGFESQEGPFGTPVP